MHEDLDLGDTLPVPPLTIVGLSLAGPSSTMDTAMAIGHTHADGLTIEDCRIGMSDTAILAMARRLVGTPCIYALAVLDPGRA